MIKHLSAILLIIGVLCSIVAPVFAAEKISESSAYIDMDTAEITLTDMRRYILEKFLRRYNSPLAQHAQLIIEQADANEIPWTLLVAISGVESTFCKAHPKGSHNCWGWNNGNYSFSDYRHAIKLISRKLKTKYYDRGLDTVHKIGKVYAPPTNSWSKKVTFFMKSIEDTDITPSPIEQLPL